ncbi:zinc finger MYM-type protein 1-like [Macrosteles quadrilineatus]|uniref:zinc finger MYM-type protein 1-like n=1 Tax=Macrosteles quadrilineatus TaxID=74068 RepID=UPI0023E303E4|nr:zinc finger MYM-type protein 1-like [Macrosteles quadrilineatus]
MSGNKKPSGAFHRKRKLERSKEDEKQSKVLQKFLTTASSSEKIDNTTNKVTKPDGNEKEILSENTSLLPEPPVIDKSVEEPKPVENEVVSHDPGNWPANIPTSISDIIVQRGPEQVFDVEFPVNNQGRRFSVNSYRRRMDNGEEISRPWLVYSICKDAIFCFCCRLFGKTHSSPLTSENGYCDWKHMSGLLSEHEGSPSHMQAFQTWMDCSIRLKSSKTIDAKNQEMIKREVERWKEVIKRIVILIEFLGSQNLAFRGSSDKLNERGNGNFLKLVEFVGKFDVVIAEHIRKITSKETYVHYLGKNVQNEIIKMLGSMIHDHILSDVLKSTYYSVILDCTPDVSRTEQMSLVVRFVQCESGEEPEIHERFLGFIPVESTTGEALTDVLLNKLKDMKLSLKNMRGQGYDNGSNMKGKNAGVQNRILTLNPRAFFVPCSAHSLNLVVNDSALSCNEAVGFFMIIQEVYNYFSASTHRWSVLKKHVTSLTVKPLSETRWESRIDAVIPFRYQLGEIFDALFELSTDSAIDAYRRNAALGLARKVKNYRFICSLIVWHAILSRINVISKQLQKEDFSIANAIELISSAKTYFDKMRTEKGFEEVLVDAREVSETVDIEASFPPEHQVRARKIKRQFDYEAPDEPIVDPKKAFRSNFYYHVLDCAINSLEERFTQLSNYNDVFGFCYNIKKEDKSLLLKKCADLQLALTDGDHRDIKGHQMYQELLVVQTLLPENCGSKPMDVLKYLTKNRLCENFPNLCIALRIILTIPVSVASGERSFSKLKLIKNYLRSNMSQERLVGLSLMSIEYDVLQKIDIDTFIKDFAEKKARKVSF